MNLGKLFNFKYLKQNVKKSKGFLTVLVFIIPVITALILMGNNSTEYYVGPTYQFTVAIANFFGMYVIPVIISYLLYGYVYKKNSVDFVNSMPITRTTIFTTNFIGGVLLIAIIQVLTAVVTAICTVVLSKIYIAPAMILDIFIAMFFAYTFVFACASLAMTVSGNFLTQIVVTMLIVFLIPFVCTFGSYDINKEINLELGNRVVTINKIIANNYTFPSTLFCDIVGDSADFFNVIRDIKTVVLTIFYFGIGLYLFNKRKMENVEVSFSKTWVHLVVKGITLVPMIFIIQLLEINDIFFVIAIALVFIYYCLYDFITNKKVPVKITIPAFIISVVLLIGLDNSVDFVSTKLLQERISVDDINAISLASTEYYGGMLNIHRDNKVSINIEDKEIIKKVCEGLVDEKHRDYMGYDYPYQSKYVYLKLKMKNGKEKYSFATIDYAVYEEVFDTAVNDEKNLDKYAEYYKLGKDTYIIENDRFLSEEETERLINIYNNIAPKTLLEVEEEFTDGYNKNWIPQPQFEAYTYREHELVEITINPFLSQEIFEEMNRIIQEEVKEAIEKVDKIGENKYIDANIQDRRIGRYSANDTGYISFIDTTELMQYVRQHLNEKIDMNDNFYVISVNNSNIRYINFYLKETEELDDIIARNRIYYEDTDVVSYNDDVEFVGDYEVNTIELEE